MSLTPIQKELLNTILRMGCHIETAMITSMKMFKLPIEKTKNLIIELQKNINTKNPGETLHIICSRIKNK